MAQVEDSKGCCVLHTIGMRRAYAQAGASPSTAPESHAIRDAMALPAGGGAAPEETAKSELIKMKGPYVRTKGETEAPPPQRRIWPPPREQGGKIANLRHGNGPVYMLHGGPAPARRRTCGRQRQCRQGAAESGLQWLDFFEKQPSTIHDALRRPLVGLCLQACPSEPTPAARPASTDGLRHVDGHRLHLPEVGRLGVLHRRHVHHLVDEHPRGAGLRFPKILLLVHLGHLHDRFCDADLQDLRRL